MEFLGLEGELGLETPSGACFGSPGEQEACQPHSTCTELGHSPTLGLLAAGGCFMDFCSAWVVFPFRASSACLCVCQEQSVCVCSPELLKKGCLRMTECPAQWK